MKTIKAISALALVIGLAACENYDLPNPPGQAYPAPDGYFENSGIVMTSNGNPINLVEANQANRFVTVATIDQLDNFPADYTLAIDMQLGATGDFNKSATLKTTIEGGNVTLNPDVLNGAIQEVLTRKPGTYDVPVRFLAYAERGTTRMGLGGVGASYGAGTLKVTTLDPVKVIEDSYYVVPCDASLKPDFSKGIKMNNTAGGNISAYDNPEFAVQIDVPETEPYYYVIAPASVMESKDASAVYGCLIGADGVTGKLSTDYPASAMPIFGSVLLTVNMADDALTVTYAFDVLYPISGTTQPKNAMKLYTDDYITFYGVTALNQRWTLYTSPDKSGVVFKLDPTTETEVAENGLSESGFMTTNADGVSLTVPVKGNCLYYMDVNLVLKTYTAKALQTLTVIGSGNNWTLDTAIPLTASKDLKTWTATDVYIKDEFKINANGAWDYDFGGSTLSDTEGQKAYKLDFKGGNLQAPEGTYDVRIDFSALPYTLTLTKK